MEMKKPLEEQFFSNPHILETGIKGFSWTSRLQQWGHSFLE
jgi:hypothetical protein